MSATLSESEQATLRKLLKVGSMGASHMVRRTLDHLLTAGLVRVADRRVWPVDIEAAMAAPVPVPVRIAGPGQLYGPLEAIAQACASAIFVVSYGAGVDSSAMLIGLWARGIRPCLILFADLSGTKTPKISERARTLRHLWDFNEWLMAHGMPSVTIVRYRPVSAPYDSLEDLCYENETLPPVAFGGKDCSIKFKGQPQDRYVLAQDFAQAALAAGRPILRVIGYDAGLRDSVRCEHAVATYAKPKADHRFRYWYPLQDWHWTREQCLEVIQAAGAPVPGKSSCFFCPSMKVTEIRELQRDEPDLYERALAMEERARNGKHGLRTVKGLGRSFSWTEAGLLAEEARAARHQARKAASGLRKAQEAGRRLAKALTEAGKAESHRRRILGLSDRTGLPIQTGLAA